MKFIKEFPSIVATYILVILYVAFTDNKIIAVVLILGLFAITAYVYSHVKNELHSEQKMTVNTLLNRLDRSEKENEEAYKRFLSLSKTMGSGVFMVNDEGLITFSNKDMENYFDVDFNRKDYKELIEIRPLYNFINKAYLLEETLKKQIKYNQKIFELIATPLFEGDMFAGTLILVHDITQLKTAEKFQKRFTQDVSHELRTPLSAIKGYSEILLRDLDMNKDDKIEFLTTINKQSQRMETILNDLMVISKLDRIDYELDLVSGDIKEIIDESVQILKSKIEDKKLALYLEVEKAQFMFDKVKISQVLINLVKNAINYTDEGSITVTGTVVDDTYRIIIQDTGIGIEDSKKEQIFKRFYRVDKARSRDTGGSGLGLSISKNVVLKHGGRIYVESQENQGSSFIIELPMTE
jgi:two-component system phosphate regulon sensor histidine kinase PhoR